MTTKQRDRVALWGVVAFLLFIGSAGNIEFHQEMEQPVPLTSYLGILAALVYVLWVGCVAAAEDKDNGRNHY
jgi:hypothetical protein